jgi:hypothetical protein
MEMKRMGININRQLEKDFKSDVRDRHNRIKGVYGSEVENAMKLYLTLHGRDLYLDDPDVLELLGRVGGSFNPHTHNISKKENISSDVVVDLVEEIKSLKAEVKQLRREVKGKPSKKTGSMADFKKQFKAEYGDFKQVSRRDIVHFVTDNYNVHDSRAIQNRINFLIAHEVLEPYTQNVFNIKN